MNGGHTTQLRTDADDDRVRDGASAPQWTPSERDLQIRAHLWNVRYHLECIDELMGGAA